MNRGVDAPPAREKVLENWQKNMTLELRYDQKSLMAHNKPKIKGWRLRHKGIMYKELGSNEIDRKSLFAIISRINSLICNH